MCQYPPFRYKQMHIYIYILHLQYVDDESLH